MGVLTENMKDVVGIEAEWFSGSRWATPVVKEVHPDFPHVLFVDEDVKLAKRIARIARQHHIRLATCRSVKDLRHLESEGPFDVAILDFDSGELARKQVGHFLGYRIPILIVGQSQSSEVLEKDFPNVIQKILDKNVEASVILEEALALVGARSLLKDLKLDNRGKNEHPVIMSRVWHVLWLVLVAAVVIFTYPSVSNNFSSPHIEDGEPLKNYRWDKEPSLPNSNWFYAHLKPSKKDSP